MKPSVAIIVATYNSERYLKETLISIKEQSFTNWVCIIVDDCSTDNTPGLVSDFIFDDARFSYFRLERNKGAAGARNYGLSKITPDIDYICFCDSDDHWDRKKIEVQLNVFSLDPKIKIVCSAFDRIDESNNYLNSFFPPERFGRDEMLGSNLILLSSGMISRKHFATEFSFPLMRRRQDYGLWLTLIKNENEVLCIQEPLVKYRVVRNSVSSNKVAAFFGHILVLIKFGKPSLMKIPGLIINYIAVAMRKRV